MSVSWITHKGKRILYIDYSQCTTKEQTIELLEEVANIFRLSPAKLLTLDNFDKAFGSPEYMKRANELGSVFRPKRLRSAVIGVVGIKKVILQSYCALSQDKLVPFDSREKALAYLVSGDD